ncbi:MAG TPA: ribosome silencing factor [Thermodesulfobacteriota bacterium]
MTDTLARVIRAAEIAFDKKAEGLAVLDVRALTSYTDYFLICHGRSDRQVQTIAEAIQTTLKAEGVRPLAVEGADAGQWVLMDYDSFVVHVFYEPVRAYYDLDALWADAERVPLPAHLQSAADYGRGARFA